MESDLEEGEIVEEVEDAGKRQPAVVSRRRSAQGRKARKKSPPKRPSVDGRHNKRMTNGVATHHDFHRHHHQHHRNKSTRKKETPKRQVIVAEAHSETTATSSRTKLVISVNNKSTMATAHPKSTKPVCDTDEGPAGPVRKPVKFSIKPPKKTPALVVNRNYFAENLMQSLTDDTSEISNGSDDDDTRSIISLPAPQKTPPELIVLDSDEENDEDVELLELRKQALEDLMAKIGREARESANKENNLRDVEEVDEPYSPPDDEAAAAKVHQNNIENVLPDESEPQFPSIHQPPATFLGLREQNFVDIIAEEKTGKAPSAPTFLTSQQLHSEPASYPLGAGDVDMRLLTYPQPESATFVPPTSATFVRPTSTTFVPASSATFVPTSSATFVPTSSATFVPSSSTFVPPSSTTPISMQSPVQYPLYHPHRHQLNPYNGHGLMAPSANIPFAFGGGPAPSNQGYSNNSWDHRPWQSYPGQQQQQHNMAPFGFPCPVPSPNIVHPTPHFSIDHHHARLPIERISRTTVFPPFPQASPSVLRPIPPTALQVAGEHFKLDVDDRSAGVVPGQSAGVIPDRSTGIIPDPSSNETIPEKLLSPPASPPPEETGMVIILKPPSAPPEKSTPKGKQSGPKGKQSDSKGKQSGSKGKQSGSKGNQSGSKGNQSGSKGNQSGSKANKSPRNKSRRRQRIARRRENEDSERSRRTSSRRASRPRRHSASPSRRSRQASRDDPPDPLKEQNLAELPPDLWPLSPVRVEENIVVAVCNENALPPPPAPPPPPEALDDSVQEDEEILRAQLLLEIANKKKFNAAAASVAQTPASSAVSFPAPPVQTVSTVQQTLPPAGQQTSGSVAQISSVPDQPTFASFQPTSTPVQANPVPTQPPPGPVIVPQALTFPFPLKGTGATITKTILNPRLKNRQVIRVVNNSGPLSLGPNLTLRKTISNTNTNSIRPNLHTIQRTVVNTNLLKKNSYNQNVDPVMRNMKITVPNQVTRLIIPAGGDSSSDEESSGGSPVKVTQSKTLAAGAKRKLPIASSLLPIGFEDSLNSLLRSSREMAKPLKPKPPLNLNLKHLSLAKQEEYMRLKSQLEQYERKIQKKQARKEVGVVEAAPKTVPRAQIPARAASKVPAAASKSPKDPPNLRPRKLDVPVVDQEVSSSNQEDATNLNDVIIGHSDSVSTSQGGDKETGEITSSLMSSETIENVTETEVTSSNSFHGNQSNNDKEMTDLGVSSASDPENEDVDMNEAQLLGSDDEARIMAEANAETEEDEPFEMTQMTSATAMYTEKPFVVDSVKEREELYLREKLLKAALLKKMEVSNDKLKLRKFEGDVLSSRKSINRELTSLLSEMVKLSDMKVKMKSQEEKVLMLREQLYAAEQQLNVTMGKVETYETRRKDLTSRVISMRKEFSGLVKECRRQGQKIQGDYNVPTGGALEMKSKLVEVCNQNLVFRRDNQKLKLSPRKQSLARRSMQSLSATLVAANRVKRSFNLRFPHTPTTKLPSTPQQFKYSARRAGATSNRYKGRHPHLHFNKTFGLLTKHAAEQSEESEESVFLLPKRHFKDVMMGPEVKPVPRGMIPILPYSVYESPLSSIRDPGLSDRDSSTPALGRNLDPFVTLCHFELRGMCNSVKCPFQHLYRPKTTTTTTAVMAD